MWPSPEYAHPKQIGEAVDWMCENPELAREIGERGRQSEMRGYNSKSEAKKLVNLHSGFASLEV